MRTFKDKTGRGWALMIDVPAIELLESRVGVNARIAAMIADRCAALWSLRDDPVLFVRVLFVLCAEQCEKVGVKPEQFARGMDGDALDAAFVAFIHALADFSPSRLREPIRALAAATNADRSTLSGSATSSPASSESTPVAPE